MLTRRILLSSGIVAGSSYAFGLPSEPPPPVITASPLFSVQTGDAFVLNTRRDFPSDDTTLPRVLSTITRESFSDHSPVKSIIAAEDRLFTLAPDQHLAKISQINEPVKVRHHLAELFKERRDPAALPFTIMRACNSIAKESRRGFGNHVLMHPDMFANLPAQFLTPVEPVSIGRWTKMAMIIRNIDLFVGTALPANEIVVFYRARQISQLVDGPAAVLDDGNSHLAMSVYPDKIFRFAVKF